jgi:hypothetical protein
MFTRRLGPVSVLPCSGGHGCPDLLEMESGDFAVIGTDITDIASAKLPTGSGCGPGERIVQVPRRMLMAAKHDIP